MHFINIQFVVVYHLFVVVVLAIFLDSYIINVAQSEANQTLSMESAQHSRNIMRDKRVLPRSEAGDELPNQWKDTAI